MKAKVEKPLVMLNRIAISVTQLAGLLVVALLCAGATKAQQRQSTYQLCFPLISWFGPQHPAPTIDGQIDNDAGWDGAFKYVYGNGSLIPDVIVRGIRDNNNLYIGIQAYNLDSLTASGDTATLVVLAFDPGNGMDSQVGNTANMLRFHIFPINTIPTPSPGYRGPVFATNYWSGGRSTWNTSSGTLNPSWANVQVGYDLDPNNPGKFMWSLEMKLPVTGNLTTGNASNGLILPDSGPFGLYVDVFPVVKVGINETLVPRYWPANAPEPGCAVGGSCTPNEQTPDASQWGNATRDPACGGASVTLAPPLFDNIFTSNSPNSKIALNKPNTFGAYVQNTSVDASSGTATPVAAQVTGTFTIANWGIPALPSWGLVPTTPLGPGVLLNPTSPTTIDPTACMGPTNNNNPSCILKIGPWTLNTTEQGQYSTANMEHQCIRVQLAPAPGSNTVVLNSVAQRNMDFVMASRFERIAEISAKGYPPRVGAAPGTDQLFDLHVYVRQEVLKAGEAATATAVGPASTLQATEHKGGEGRVVSQLTWIANGCRHTGRYMTILEHKLEICEPVGAFGYVIRHVGARPVEKWNIRLTGPNLTVVAGQPNTYQILIPQDGVATVTTHAEPREGGKVAVFVDAGAGIPHGTFSNVFNTGFSLNAGLEYMATSHFSAEGIFGYHRFTAKVGGGALNLYQFSANGKVYLSSGGPFRPFVNAGVGGYDFTPGGGTYFGGNVGAGVLREFGPHWGLQASYNFHTVNTPVTTKFSTAQLGLRFVF